MRNFNLLIKFSMAIAAVFALQGCGRGVIEGEALSKNFLVTLEKIEISPAVSTVPKNVLVDYVVTGIYSDGSTRTLSADLTFESSDVSIANFGVPGALANQAKSLATGSTNIIARYKGKSASSQMTVTAALLQTIQISPNNGTVPAGYTQQMQATGLYDDGSMTDLTSTVTWSSGTPSVASINSAGLASGLVMGTTVITATTGSVSATTNLTVSTATLTELVISPSAIATAKGTNIQYSVTGKYSDMSQRDLTTTAQWSSSATNIATIGASTGLAYAQNQGVATITATVGSVSAQAGISVSSATLSSIAVTPSTTTISKGLNVQYTATGTYSDGSTQNLTDSVIWSTSDANVASISNASNSHGYAQAVNVGTASMIATWGTVSSQAAITVTSATLSSIAVTPSGASVPAGNSQQFVATGTYSDGSTANITSSVNWTSSNASIGSISNANGSKGLLVSTQAGASNITATLGSVSNQVPFSVSAPVLTGIAISPSSPASIALGLTRQFSATGTYSDGSTANITNGVTWSSSDSSIGSVSSSGLVTSHNQGTITVTASSGGVSAQVSQVISAPALVDLDVTPINGSVADGLTAQMTATGSYTDGSTQNLTAQVTWGSSNNTVATINSAGLLTSESPGSVNITASLPGGMSDQVSFTVLPAVMASLAISPNAPSVSLGNNQQFAATATYTDGSTADVTGSVTWGSSQPLVATITPTGLAQSIAQGTTTISATSGSISSSTPLMVGSIQLTAIQVASVSPTLALGLFEQFVATGIYTDLSTSDITASVTWGISNPLVALISNIPGTQGLVSTLLPGTTNVTATLGSVSGQAPLSITAAQLQSIAVNSSVASSPKGSYVQYTAVGTYTNGSTADITTTVTWASADTSIAEISNIAPNKGQLFAKAVGGPVSVSATFNSIVGSKNITVTNPTLLSIAVTPGTVGLLSGLARQLTATGTYSDGSTANITNTVAWSVTGNILCGINTTGYMVCVSLTNGTANAVLNGVTGTAQIKSNSL